MIEYKGALSRSCTTFWSAVPSSANAGPGSAGNTCLSVGAAATTVHTDQVDVTPDRLGGVIGIAADT